MTIRSLLITAFFTLALAAPASAAVQIGDTALDPSTPGNNSIVSVAAPGTRIASFDGAGFSYHVPFNGVITSVAAVGGAPATASSVRVQAFRPSGGLATTLGGATITTSLGGIQVMQSQARIPVLAGDFLGVAFLTANAYQPARLATGYVNQEAAGQVFAEGSAFTPTVSHLNQRILASAIVEPDVDNDGYGDETQDGCVGTFGRCFGVPPQGLCRVPALTKLTYTSATAKVKAATCNIKRSGSKSKKAKVSTQSIPVGTTVLGGTAVSVKMKLKKKAKKKK